MKISTKKYLIIFSAVLVITLSFGFIKSDDKDFQIIKNLDVFYSLFRELNLFYVDETNPEELIETGINSMLKSLDPYTVYIPESDMDDFNFMTTQKYGGIGSIIRQIDGKVIIAEPYEGSPSAKAGLQAGDMIISVDGVQTKGKDLSSISERLKGTPGTEVLIEIQKTGQNKTQKIKLTREQIKINNVSYSGRVDENTGYIRLSNFAFGAGEEVKEAFKKLKEEEKIEKLILDLRGNPGGLLIEAVRVCNLFVPQGELIASTKGKVKEWDQSYNTTQEPLDTEIPIVVIVNRGSASASEIVAGALQDLDRAVILGQRTFGKGLVQTSRKLKYNAQLKVTTAKYYIPSGRCIQALDYTHRNEDGSVGYRPDSLISEYKTKNGRIVYDGGGITPDIIDTAGFVSFFTLNLYTQNIIFDFASQYLVSNPEAPDREDFSIREKDYSDFKKFVDSKSFEYETSSERALDELIKKAKAEKYYDLSKDEFQALSEKLRHDNNTDLDHFKDEITDLINEEILGRYFYQSGRIAYSVKKDEQISRAGEVLENELNYKNILLPD